MFRAVGMAELVGLVRGAERQKTKDKRQKD